jgi:hypothetical protein
MKADLSVLSIGTRAHMIPPASSCPQGGKLMDGSERTECFSSAWLVQFVVLFVPPPLGTFWGILRVAHALPGKQMEDPCRKWKLTWPTDLKAPWGQHWPPVQRREASKMETAQTWTTNPWRIPPSTHQPTKDTQEMSATSQCEWCWGPGPVP